MQGLQELSEENVKGDDSITHGILFSYFGRLYCCFIPWRGRVRSAEPNQLYRCDSRLWLRCSRVHFFLIFFFIAFFFRLWSNELAGCVPGLLLQPRNTRKATSLRRHCLMRSRSPELTTPTMRYDCFFTSVSKLWNFRPESVFNEFFNLALADGRLFHPLRRD